MAIVAAAEGAAEAAAEAAWGALDRGRRAGHLLGSAVLERGAPIAEVALWAEAAKSLVLGSARVDERPGVGRAQIRALAEVAVQARGAFEKAASQQGAWCLPPAPAGMPGQGAGAGPQTPPGWWPEGRADELSMTATFLDGEDGNPLFSAIMTLSSRLRCELTCMP